MFPSPASAAQADLGQFLAACSACCTCHALSFASYGPTACAVAIALLGMCGGPRQLIHGASVGLWDGFLQTARQFLHRRHTVGEAGLDSRRHGPPLQRPLPWLIECRLRTISARRTLSQVSQPCIHERFVRRQPCHTSSSIHWRYSKAKYLSSEKSRPSTEPDYLIASAELHCSPGSAAVWTKRRTS